MDNQTNDPLATNPFLPVKPVDKPNESGVSDDDLKSDSPNRQSNDIQDVPDEKVKLSASKNEKSIIPLDSSKVLYWEETQNLIEKLEASFGGRIITFYISMEARLTEDEIAELYNHLKKMGEQEQLTLVIYGPGGNGIAAYRIVHLLRNFTKRLVIVVPDIAASAMTMLTLGADMILMGPQSALSPIDSSITNHPLAPLDANGRPVSVEINQVSKFLELVKGEQYANVEDFTRSAYYALSKKVHPIFLGTIQRSLSLSKLLTRGILKTHMQDDVTITKIVDKLNDDYPTHSYPILLKDLQKFGLSAQAMRGEKNDLCLELFEYYGVLTKGHMQRENEITTTVKRFTVIESREFRSFYLHVRKQKLMKEQWVTMSSDGKFEHATIVKNDKGYFEARLLNVKQFRDWINGREVKLNS